MTNIFRWIQDVTIFASYSKTVGKLVPFQRHFVLVDSQFIGNAIPVVIICHE